MASGKQDKGKEGIRHLVRVVNTDLDGSKKLITAMRKIKGVNTMYAKAVCTVLHIDPDMITGTLTDADVQKLDDALLHPLKFHIPAWLLNRRKDYETGEDMHLLTANLRFVQDEDIKRMKKTKSYKGMRHQWGLPVRGQRTKSNFRRNKGKVSLGVQRKKTAKSGK